jgi:hypothetical protein
MTGCEDKEINELDGKTKLSWSLSYRNVSHLLELILALVIQFKLHVVFTGIFQALVLPKSLPFDIYIQILLRKQSVLP